MGRAGAGSQYVTSTQDHRATISSLRWMLDNFTAEVPGVRSVVVVSVDGLPLLAAPPQSAEDAEQLATVVSGIGGLTNGAADVMDGGRVKQTMVAMADGCLVVMQAGDGSLLGVLTEPDCDLSVAAYHMELFVGRVGHVLTPGLRGELTG